jgi:hypothetical protein
MNGNLKIIMDSLVKVHNKIDNDLSDDSNGRMSQK